MAGRNDVAIAAALEAMAQAMQNQPNADENAGSRSLATFQRENPPVFKGTHDPDGALDWLKELERVFRVMDCTPAQKVRYGTHMLAKEADDWWLETLARLEFSGEEVTWNVFRREFLRKYYPEDVRGKKEIEFLELTQGNKSVTEYAAKFTELIKFYPHFDGEGAEFSKCIKFQNGLRSEIKKAVGYQKIRLFSDLVDSCRIFEEDSNAHHKMVSDRRGKNQQSRGKPYDAGKGKQRVTHGQRSSGGDAPARIVCFKCGQPGHKSNACTTDARKCFRCGKMGHAMSDCKHKDMVCFTCGEEGHIGSQCPKKKAQSGGKVLGLMLSSMNGEMAVDLPAKGSVTTSLMCSKCPLSIFDKDFVVDLICLPLSGLDVILGMNWLEYNYVHINCFNKSLRFSSPEEEGVGLLTGKQLRQLMQDEAQMFSLMASLSFENQVRIDELKVVREFPDVFPDEIPDVPPEREVEFAIDLVPGTRPVSMAPYRMSASELSELKKQLEELLEKKFVRPSVSLDAMLQWEAPKSATKIRSFLGLVGYYRRFIEGFSKLALPLTRLTCKGKAFVWDIRCEESFNELKKRLTSAPNGKVVAYASRQLRTHEKNYPTHDLELAAVFRDLSLVCEVTPHSVMLGMLKINNDFLDNIKEAQKLDVKLVDLMVGTDRIEKDDFNGDDACANCGS
ncbi:uncharacterized protein LOC131646840 [Vicia villosa]|uniref:uncharacterized protein LOC131646840 n=1 Tax=Vicia villosa TaxID=3911 RepID=UPI00273C9902|nr:uncharacterized protein LOC131646840 [Vicia villosa]